jgi:hypothetical protein
MIAERAIATIVVRSLNPIPQARLQGRPASH